MHHFNPIELIEFRSSYQLLDVRTPAEFEWGHIPGAKNLPLFSNEERAVVGTLYKQVSPEEALKKGLEFAGNKMRWYVDEAERLSSDRKVDLHCWRGGQRSQSMAWLLDKAGFEVGVLQGGYKAYRTFQRQSYTEKKLPFLILGGPTGSGKTEMLHRLKEIGEQVIDLERLAHHKGSAFGGFGQQGQLSQQQFENNLFEAFQKQDPSRRVWLENESRAIGKNGIPDGFWKQMIGRPYFQLEMPFATRVKRLVREYGNVDLELLKHTFEHIRKRLGGQNVKLAVEALGRKDLEVAAEVALRYYDKAYERSTSQMEFCKTIKIPLGQNEPGKVARQLVRIAEQHGL